ncbi:MAG: hypothetical protein PHZ04_00405 [Patescibacteria group bacterium]|nr:hypothetical protein [Patescibacteria group bacterium]MDD5555048.1 hypothetical protein [Patescibacteria group bacterium]
MLAPKKIDKNKLIAYISVIAVMIAGTGFFLYKNYSLTAVNKPMTMEISAEAGGQSSDSLDSLLKQVSLKEEGAGVAEKKETSIISKEPAKEKELLDLGLLTNTKFKKLRENTITEGGFKVGTNNPFVLSPSEED